MTECRNCHNIGLHGQQMSLAVHKPCLGLIAFHSTAVRLAEFFQMVFNNVTRLAYGSDFGFRHDLSLKPFLL